MSKNAYDATSPMSDHGGDKELAVQHFDRHSDEQTMNDGTAITDKPGQGRFDHELSAEERAGALKLAMEADPGPDILSFRYMSFVFTAFIVILNSGDNGFDGTVMSAVNSMEQFQDYFGLEAAEVGTSLVFGLYTIGQICAFLPNIYLPDKVGRRWAMFLSNVCQCTGAIITANAQNMSMFLFGRWLTGFGCTAANTAAKSYIAEITSPSSRGRWMGVLNSFYYVGQILASGISIPFGRAAGEYAWRGPMYLQCAPAGINLIFVLFLAESPRWLYARGKKDEARRVLARFHSKTGDIHSPLIDLEIHEFEQNIDLAGTDRQFWNFRTLVDTFGARYRLGLCFLVSIWGQLSGNGLITYFLPVLLGQAGIESTDRQRVLNLANSITSMAGALTGSAVVDHIGRRKLMLFAATSAFIGMVIAGGLLSPAGDQNKMRADAGISFIFLFMVFFSTGWTPLQALYPAEVLSYENRAKGLAVQGIFTNAVSTINTFGMPVALQKIGYINYFIFAAWDVVGLVLIYLFVVETKKLTLEDIDDIFESRNPKKRSFELFEEAKERAKHEKEMQRQQNA